MLVDSCTRGPVETKAPTQCATKSRITVSSREAGKQSQRGQLEPGCIKPGDQNLKQAGLVQRAEAPTTRSKAKDVHKNRSLTPLIQAPHLHTPLHSFVCTLFAAYLALRRRSSFPSGGASGLQVL